jgi:hypothetical protein
MSNSGNYLNTNYGYCKQVIYQADSPRPISQRWLDRTGRLLAVGVMYVLLLLSGCYLVEQWYPFLSHPIPAGGIAAHACATLPVFWTMLSLSVGYGYCATRIFKYE